MAFQSTCTRELLGIRVAADQPVVLNESPAETLAAALAPLVPADLWWKDPTNPPPALRLVGRPITAPLMADYVSIGVKPGAQRAHFNGVANVTTKRVQISGSELVWASNGDPRLWAYAKGDQIDVERLEIFADRVVIKSRLQFPQTDVVIWARELVLDGEGAIDTTPKPWSFKADWDQALDPDDTLISNVVQPFPAGKRTNPNVKDAGVLKKGEDKYTPKDGRPGERAGDIELRVRDLVVSKTRQSKDVRWFVARGGKGQAAEEGFAPQHADLPEVTGNDIEELFVNHIKRADYFIWPYLNASNPSKTKTDWPNDMVFPIEGDHKKLLKNRGATELHYNVVDLAIIVVTDFLGGRCSIRKVFFPRADAWRDSKSVNDLSLSDANQIYADVVQKGPTVIRAAGKNARPGGAPGQGGKGGTFSSLFQAADAGAFPLPPWVDTSGGETGNVTSSVDGGPPQGPDPAYALYLFIWPIGFQNEVSLCVGTRLKAPAGGGSSEKVEGKAGEAGKFEGIPASGPGVAPAAAKTWQDGDGALRFSIGLGRSVDWMHPLGADAALAHAKDCFRAGHRELAASALDPYFVEFAAACPADLAHSRAAVVGLQRNLVANLDYYGHPPGWLPHVDAKTVFTLDWAIRQKAMKLYRFAGEQIENFDKLNDAVQLATKVREKLDEELGERKERLGKAYVAIRDAEATLEKAVQTQKSVDARLADVKAALRQRLTDQIYAQRIFSGVTKVIGGVLKASPIGQPFIGLGGDLISGAGDFDWTQENPGEQFGATLKKIKEPINTLVTKVGDKITDPEKAGQQMLKDEIDLQKIEADQQEREIKTSETDYKTKLDEAVKKIPALEDDKTYNDLLSSLKVDQKLLAGLTKESAVEKKKQLDGKLGRGLTTDEFAKIERAQIYVSATEFAIENLKKDRAKRAAENEKQYNDDLHSLTEKRKSLATAQDALAKLTADRGPPEKGDCARAKEADRGRVGRKPQRARGCGRRGRPRRGEAVGAHGRG